MRELRSAHSALLLEDGRVLLAGGLDPDGDPLDTVEIFNSEETGFGDVRGWLHSPRVRPALRALWDGKVQVIGGDENSTLEVFEPLGRYFRAPADPRIAESLVLNAEVSPVQTTASTAGSRPVEFASRNERSSGTGADLPFLTPRPAAATVEIPDLGLRLVTGGKDDEGRVVADIDWIVTSPAQVSMDRIDHSSAMSPVVNGRGWTPGEQIVIFRQPVYPESAPPTILHATADNTGAFTNSELSPAHHRPLMTYVITAVGLSSHSVAQTTCYDAPDLVPGREDLPDYPVRVNFSVPLAGSSGSTETELGTLSWGAARFSGAVAESQVPETDPLTFDLANVPVPWDICKEIGDVEVCVTLEELTGMLHLSGDAVGSVNVDLGIDCWPCAEFNPQCWDWAPCAGCCNRWPWQCDWCGWHPCNCGCKGTPACIGCGRPDCCDCSLFDVLPELTLEAGFVFHTWADPQLAALLEASVELDTKVPIPELGIVKEFEIGEHISGEIAFGLILGINAGIDGVQVLLTASPDVAVAPGIRIGPEKGYSFEAGFCELGDCNFEFNAGAELVSLGEGFAKLSLGPELGIGVDVLDTFSMEFSAAIGAYVRGVLPLDPLILQDECEPWTIDLNAGIEASAVAELSSLDLEASIVCEEGSEDDCGFLPWSNDIADFYGTGELLVSTTTVGASSDLDPDGYVVRVARPEPQQRPEWDDVTRRLDVNDQHRFENDDLCWWNFITGVNNCFLLATDHDVTLEDVSWNCRVTPVANESVCLPFDEVAEVSFTVACVSMSAVVSNLIDELTASGAIASEDLRRELLRYLNLVELARDDGSRTKIPFEGPVARSTCQNWIAVFIRRVKEETGTLIEPAAATILLERAEDIRVYACGDDRRGPVLRAPTFDSEDRPEERPEAMDFESLR